MKDSKKRTIVISGINMTNSGILSVLSDCLLFLSEYGQRHNIAITALVHSKDMFDIPGIRFIEFPKSKKSWFVRLYYEYIHFHKLSRKIKPDIWFSMHDISPRVVAKKKFVYCHNPAPFFSPTAKDWRYGFKICVFSLFYRYLYGINIKSNTAVIVQQQWIKKAFRKLYGIDNAVTAHPQVHFDVRAAVPALDKSKIHFFYPGFPRMFKNFELIGDAITLLPQETRSRIQVHLTLEASDNRYAHYITGRYAHYKEILFLGTLSREQVAGYYKACDVLLFPSRLETWGLPITEFKLFCKPVFAIDLPYAKETVGDYDKAWYFAPDAPEQLTGLITDFVNGSLSPPIRHSNMPPPDFLNWEALFDFMFSEI